MPRAKISLPLLVLLALVMYVSFGSSLRAEAVHAPATCRHVVQASVLSSGGSPGITEASMSNGTLGQATALGEGSSGNNILRGGFWTWSGWSASGLGVMSPQSLSDRLFQNFPNPFRASTAIAYTLTANSMVGLSVFNVHGQSVRTLVYQNQAPGSYAAVWDGCDQAGEKVSPGIYFYRLDAGNHRTVRKMVLAR
jgi:hypothetical protein